MYVHTDKEVYLTGEIIWFKIYQGAEQDTSKVAYLDLLDAADKTVITAKVSLEHMRNNGSVLIPLAVPSGNYLLRAYTSWMKNSPDELFFQKQVTIINPFKSPDASRQSTYATGARFYPEGGQLVKGLGSKLAVKLSDRKGNATAGEGYILNLQKDTVARFLVPANGIGLFEFKPLTKEHTAIIITATDSFNLSLPPAAEEGYVMRAETTSTGIAVKVQTGFTGPQQVTLAIRRKNNLVATQTVPMTQGAANFDIPYAGLHGGVYQLTILNALSQAVAERLVYVAPAAPGHVKVGTGKQAYSTREQVNISINSLTSDGKPVPADLSVAVYPLDFKPEGGAPAISNYFSILSDLQEVGLSPAALPADATLAASALDDLLLVSQSRYVEWNKLTGLRKQTINYLPETTGHTVIAQVKSKSGNKPLNDQEVFLSVPGASFAFAAGHTDAQGLARFTVPELYGSKRISVTLNGTASSDYEVELLSPFYNAGTAATKQLRPFNFPATASLLEKYSINMQVQNIYHSDSMRIFYAHEALDTARFYGRPIYSYQLDNYTRFKTMEEVLREYVQEMSVGARNGKLYLKIADEARKVFNEENLLVLWDGVPLQDPHSVLQFDPLKVKRLEVVPRRFAAGGSIFNGIASFTTYNGDLAGYAAGPNKLMDYEGLQLQREFYSPSYNNTERLHSRLPDFRNTLYWAPNVFTDAKGETVINFYTGDRKGKYIAVIQGLDDWGNPVSATHQFEVK